MQLLHNEWAENSLYINPDNIAQEQYGDWNSPVAVLKAAELATKMRYECLRKRQDFVFETVFSSDEKLAFVEEAKKAGFFIFQKLTLWPLSNNFTIKKQAAALPVISMLLPVFFKPPHSVRVRGFLSAPNPFW